MFNSVFGSNENRNKNRNNFYKIWNKIIKNNKAILTAHLKYERDC